MEANESEPRSAQKEIVDIRKYGSIAVINQGEKFLVIQRADQIRAGGMFCFPGGGIENGETSKQAVVRELSEELGIAVTPTEELWQSVTDWGVHLTWWRCQCEQFDFKPDPEEVQWVGWMSLKEMAAEERMLVSNNGFMNALRTGEIEFEF